MPLSSLISAHPVRLLVIGFGHPVRVSHVSLCSFLPSRASMQSNPDRVPAVDFAVASPSCTFRLKEKGKICNLPWEAKRRNFWEREDVQNPLLWLLGRRRIGICCCRTNAIFLFWFEKRATKSSSCPLSMVFTVRALEDGGDLDAGGDCSNNP